MNAMKIGKILGKFLVSFLVGVLLMTVIVSPVKAANVAPPTGPGPWYNQTYTQWSAKVFDEQNANEIFGERYTFAQVNWIVNSLIAILTGPAVSKCSTSVATGDISKLPGCLKDSGLTLGMSGGGAIPILASLSNTLLNTRAASGVGYIKDTASRLHLVSPAYAQTGAGFNTLQPIVALWTVVRDISYFLIIIVLIAMAFMIMFRVKISPQVVITVQSALPKIIIALILITFSYAIAGLLLDLSYVITGVFAVAVKGIGSASISTASDPIALFTQMISGNGLWSILLGLVLFVVILVPVGLGISAGGLALVGVGGIGTPFVLAGILILLLAIITLVIILRLLWLLIRTAVMTVLLIVVGPLMILMGTLSPSGGFWQWIRILAANMAVYPVVTIMVFLSHYFFWGWFLGGAAGTFADCSGKGSFNTFCINTATTNVNSAIGLPGVTVGIPIIGISVAFVALALTPKAADIIQGIITGKGFSVGRGVAEAAGPVTSVVSSYAEGQSKRAPNATAALPYDAIRTLLGQLK